MSKFENPEGEAGAVSPGRDGPLNTGVFGAHLSKPFLMPPGKDGKSNSAALCSDPPGAGVSAAQALVTKATSTCPLFSRLTVLRLRWMVG